MAQLTSEQINSCSDSLVLFVKAVQEILLYNDFGAAVAKVREIKNGGSGVLQLKIIFFNLLSHRKVKVDSLHYNGTSQLIL